jgi:hypothetical protein
MVATDERTVVETDDVLTCQPTFENAQVLFPAPERSHCGSRLYGLLASL